MTTDVDLRPPGGAGAGCPSRNVMPMNAALPTCAVAATCNYRGEGRRRCTNPCQQHFVCQTETGATAAVPASARRLSLAEHFRYASPRLAQRLYRNLKPAVLKPPGTSAIPLACARPLSLYVSRARVGVCRGVRILAWPPIHLTEGPPLRGKLRLKKGSPVPGRAGRTRHHHPRHERGANHPSGPGQCLALFPFLLARACWGVRRCADFGMGTHPSGRRTPPLHGQLKLKKGSPVPGRAGRTRHHHPHREKGGNHPTDSVQCRALFPIRLARACWGVRRCADLGVRILAWPPTLHAEGPPSYGQSKLKKRNHIRGRAGRDRQHHARRESARIRLCRFIAGRTRSLPTGVPNALEALPTCWWPSWRAGPSRATRNAYVWRGKTLDARPEKATGCGWEEEELRTQRSWRPSSERLRVTSSAYSRWPPTGSP